MNEEFIHGKMPEFTETGFSTSMMPAPGTSLTDKSHVPGGSDVFRSVMKEFSMCETTSTLSDGDHRYLYDSFESDSEDETHTHTFQNVRSRKLSSSLPERWRADINNKNTRACNSPHRVQWADECSEKTIFKDSQNDKDRPRKSSPKPILKHKVNCVIIVSERS